MGRQLQLHMQQEDARAFCEFIAARDPVIFTLKSSDSPIVATIPDPTVETRVMAICSLRILPSITRKKVATAEGEDYFRIDDSLPVLEFSPSVLCKWNEKPALRQGRVYVFSDSPDQAYLLWYESIARWVRKHFVRNPITALGGYIGPTAYEWFKTGGILLPMFAPPSTPEWTSFVEHQHSPPRQNDGIGSS